jgi:hypothetical protein
VDKRILYSLLRYLLVAVGLGIAAMTLLVWITFETAFDSGMAMWPGILLLIAGVTMMVAGIVGTIRAREPVHHDRPSRSDG